MPEQTTAEAFKKGAHEAFAQDLYWTSTEFGPGSAWFQNFASGDQDDDDKDWSGRVRAVRKYPL